MHLVDSHCHLHYPQFQEKLPEIVANAAQYNVKTLLTVAVKLADHAAIQAIIQRFTNIYGSVGVHPHETKAEIVSAAQLLALSQKEEKIVALGETGLDLYYNHSDFSLQKASFVQHIEAAQISKLPLIIHTRSADQQTIDMLQAEMRNAPFTGVIHCFSGSKELAYAALDLGLYISLSGIITFKKATELQEIARNLPLDKLLVETDSPYLAPEPYRSQTNEPARVYQVAQKLAALKQTTLATVAELTTTNFHTLFTNIAKPG